MDITSGWKKYRMYREKKRKKEGETFLGDVNVSWYVINLAFHVSAGCGSSGLRTQAGHNMVRTSVGVGRLERTWWEPRGEEKGQDKRLSRRG